MYDLIVRKGTVIDGTGASAFRTDVAVRGGSIAAVGQLDGCQASRVIDAEGRLVVPGFIDSHSHADCMVAQCPDLESLTVQGVTTICTGHCGIGIAPVHDYYMSTFNDEDAVARVIPHLFAGMRPGHVPAVDARPFKEAYKEVYGVDFDWSTWGKYLAHIERTGVGVNMVPLVGHGQLRHQTMGTDYRRPASPEEVDKMCVMLRQCMEDGANGLSFGFDYDPGIYAETPEIEALARVVAEHDGMLTAHVQHSGKRHGKVQEGFQPHQGYREILEVGLKSGARVHISHIRPGFTGLPDDSLILEACRYVMRLIDEYRDKGVRVSWDVLPHYAEATFFYPMFATKLRPYVEQVGSLTRFQGLLRNPEYRIRLREELVSCRNPGVNSLWGLDVGSPRWDTFREICQCSVPEYMGKTIRELAEERGVESIDMFLDILAADPRTCGRIRLPAKSRLGLDFYANLPDASFGLDVGGCNYDCDRETRPDMPPRYMGAFTEFSGMVHVLCSKVIDKKETLIAAVTGNTARNLGLHDRGFIKEGLRADLVVVDWDKLDTNVDYVTPNRPPKGIEYVFINGELAAEHGRPLNPRSGMVVRNEDRAHR